MVIKPVSCSSAPNTQYHIQIICKANGVVRAAAAAVVTVVVVVIAVLTNAERHKMYSACVLNINL